MKHKDINTKVKDIDSYITGKGKHNRLIVSKRGNEIFVREDLIGLPLATKSQQREVILLEWPELMTEDLIFFSTTHYYPEAYYPNLVHEYTIK